MIGDEVEYRRRRRRKERKRKDEGRIKITIQKYERKNRITVYLPGWNPLLPHSTYKKQRMHGLVGIITQRDTADGLLTVLTFPLQFLSPEYSIRLTP